LRVLGKAGLRSITTASNPLTIPPLDEAQTDNIIAFLSAQKARSLAQTAKLSPAPVLAYARIATPEARNWVSPRGALDGSNFSALSGITPGNVAQLQARWSARLSEGGNATAPLVVDGVLYAAGGGGNVHALDAQGGLPIWQFERGGNAPITGNRGMAMLDGRIFVATQDDKLIALNAHSGRALWEAPSPMTAAPLALRTRIITGMSSSTSAARGALRAVDPATGEALWRLETTAPEATGGMTSSIGAYEAQNVTLYWSTTRATDDGADGDSILAMNANTGAVTWRHKLARGAGGDGVVLADQTVGGPRRALLLHLGRDGLLTLLDRTSGKPVRTQSLSKTRVETPSLSFDRSSFVLFAALGADVAAVDARNGRVLWRAELGGQVTGVLATRGGVVFATLADGQMVALAEGKPLWRFRAGGPIGTSPVSYAIGGRQFIAVTAGNMVTAFALPQ
jgi:outer membrane protein assembly factor BamB